MPRRFLELRLPSAHASLLSSYLTVPRSLPAKKSSIVSFPPPPPPYPCASRRLCMLGAFSDRISQDCEYFSSAIYPFRAHPYLFLVQTFPIKSSPSTLEDPPSLPSLLQPLPPNDPPLPPTTSRSFPVEREAVLHHPCEVIPSHQLAQGRGCSRRRILPGRRPFRRAHPQLALGPREEDLGKGSPQDRAT